MASRPRAESQSDEKRQIKVQKRTFTKWINSKVKPSGIKVKDIDKDLCDGLVLIKLMQALVPGKPISGR